MWIAAVPLILILVFFGVRNHRDPGEDHGKPETTIELGCQGEGPCSPSPVPEPGSALLLAVGGLLIGKAVRK